MYKGKKTCKILKDIRKQIAEANDIEYIVEECKYQGDCLGTCPKCEADVRYLEAQLNQRRILGKAVVLAGLSAGVFAVTSCDHNPFKTDQTTGAPPQDTTDIVDSLSETIGEVSNGKLRSSIKFVPPSSEVPKEHPRDSANVTGDIDVQVKK